MKKYYSIGLMSGTSMDGLDICYAEFTKSDRWTFEIIVAETVPYTEEWIEKLSTTTTLNPEELLSLNSEYGFYLGEKVKEFINSHKIEKVDLIASHGHTVYHQPSNKFTLQIGDGRAIKQHVDLPIIYDFRSQDVIMGGNGAPLVPIGDELLFSHYDACLNLGGFSNISLKVNKERIAFDICPVNIVLNHYAQMLGEKFDYNGELAKSGSINDDVLTKLNNLDFYKQSYPKSLGYEWVKDQISPLLNDIPVNILATFTEHILHQLENSINKFSIKNLLITGGGAHNKFLIKSLKSRVSFNITIPDSQTIEFKEALIFGFMGVLKFIGENNVISSATGSREDHSSGLIV